MRARVELRRHKGHLIPRYQPQAGFTGDIHTARREVNGREVVYLTMTVDYKQGYPGVRPTPPILYEPRLLRVFDTEMRWIGFCQEADLSLQVQEWDCQILPERLVTSKM